jgi:hypothetical protein
MPLSLGHGWKRNGLFGLGHAKNGAGVLDGKEPFRNDHKQSSVAASVMPATSSVAV